MAKSFFLHLVFSLLASLVLSSPARASDEPSEVNEDIALSIGRTASWPVAKAGEISVSNGAIIRVVDQSQALKITALKLGVATIRIGLRRLEVNVLPEAAYRIYSVLRELLKDRRGLTLSSTSGRLKVTGRLLRASDWLAIAEALPNASADQFTFQAGLEPEVESAIRPEIQKRLNAIGLAHVDLRFTPDAVATVGVEPKDAKARAEKLLSPFGIRVEMNTSVLTLEPMVRVKILVAEVKKSFKRTFGIHWPSAFGGTLLPDLTFAPNSAEFSLDALEDHGWGRVLASPTLLCRSGKDAEFMAGGEFPIKLSSFKSSEVVWKNYGILLRVKPVADANGRMSIAIETEVSALDMAHAVENIPGLLTNRMQTHFDLSSTRTIALSGLIKSDLGRQTTGLPGLSSIPVIGSLFSSQDFRDDRSELIIFVTPSVLRPDDETPSGAIE